MVTIMFIAAAVALLPILFTTDRPFPVPLSNDQEDLRAARERE